MSDTSGIADLMLALCAEAGPAKTIDPNDVARAYGAKAGRADAWTHYLQGVRNTAVQLAREGRIVIYRKGRPTDPETFRGVYRLGCTNLS